MSEERETGSPALLQGWEPEQCGYLLYLLKTYVIGKGPPVNCIPRLVIPFQAFI